MDNIILIYFYLNLINNHKIGNCGYLTLLLGHVFNGNALLVEYMKRTSGMSLVESVVAIGLSGIFTVILATALAQTLQITRASQDELLAIKTAELIIENAKATPYETFKNLTGSTQKFLVNIPDTSSPPIIRNAPVQLDLESTNKVFGTVNGNSGTVSSNQKWTKSSGNYFDAEAYEDISDSTASTSNLDSVLISVTVNFKSTNAGSAATQYPKKIRRQIYIFANGGHP